MLAIADTSPLNYLILIDEVELLPRLYRQIILPHAAWDELKHPGAPVPVSQWANALPVWVEVKSAPNTVQPDPSLEALESGDREAITLAELYRTETKVPLLLDEEAARQQAAIRRINATGILGRS